MQDEPEKEDVSMQTLSEETHTQSLSHDGADSDNENSGKDRDTPVLMDTTKSPIRSSSQPLTSVLSHPVPVKSSRSLSQPLSKTHFFAFVVCVLLSFHSPEKLFFLLPSAFRLASG
jgi:hypothetical protein